MYLVKYVGAKSYPDKSTLLFVTYSENDACNYVKMMNSACLLMDNFYTSNGYNPNESGPYFINEIKAITPIFAILTHDDALLNELFVIYTSSEYIPYFSYEEVEVRFNPYVSASESEFV